jgi:hypothetical protein
VGSQLCRWETYMTPLEPCLLGRTLPLPLIPILPPPSTPAPPHHNLPHQYARSHPSAVGRGGGGRQFVLLPRAAGELNPPLGLTKTEVEQRLSTLLIRKLYANSFHKSICIYKFTAQTKQILHIIFNFNCR